MRIEGKIFIPKFYQFFRKFSSIEQDYNFPISSNFPILNLNNHFLYIELYVNFTKDYLSYHIFFHKIKHLRKYFS